MSSYTDSDIRALWRNPNFSGSFTGLSNFATALATEKKIHISRTRLFGIMEQDQDFILETKRKRKRFPRRKLTVHGFSTVWQSDIADMFEHNGYKAFLCCIDLFSRNIYCELLTSKRAEEVQQKFKKIFKKVNTKPDTLESDRGSEFVGSKSFFKKQNIFFKYKVGRNKASFAEYAIQVCILFIHAHG